MTQVIFTAFEIYVGIGCLFAILMAVFGRYETMLLPSLSDFILDLFLWPFTLYVEVRGLFVRRQG